MISHLQSIVQIPTAIYNGMGEVDKDERWEPFGRVAGVLNTYCLNIHHYTSPEVIDKYGPIYTVEGSDPDPKPILQTAHQDVVPVEENTLDEWTHPPFEGYYEQQNGYLYGRGTADDKSALTGLMSALEALLTRRLRSSSHCHPCIGFDPELTERIRWSDPDGAARFLARLSPETQYLVQTSQAVDLIMGGETTNTLPEYVTLGVSHGLSPQDTIGSLQHSVLELVQNIVNKYNLRFEPFEEDDNYDIYLKSKVLGRKPQKQGSSAGTLNIQARKKYSPVESPPASGRVWDIFAGTVRHTWGRESPYAGPAPGAMTGNTGARHYQKLSKNIYRWTRRSIARIHDVDERIAMGV